MEVGTSDLCTPDVARETAPILPMVVEVGDCATDLGVDGVVAEPWLTWVLTPEALLWGTTMGLSFIVGVRIFISVRVEELERCDL